MHGETPPTSTCTSTTDKHHAPNAQSDIKSHKLTTIYYKHFYYRNKLLRRSNVDSERRTQPIASAANPGQRGFRNQERTMNRITLTDRHKAATILGLAGIIAIGSLSFSQQASAQDVPAPENNLLSSPLAPLDSVAVPLPENM